MNLQIIILGLCVACLGLVQASPTPLSAARDMSDATASTFGTQPSLDSLLQMASSGAGNAISLYNAGTRCLGAKDFTTAQILFHAALAAQDDGVRPWALYNLGETCVAQGTAYLKAGPNASRTEQAGAEALSTGDAALSHISTALNGNDLSDLEAAYWQGRGALKELHAVGKALQAALDAHGKTLRAWQQGADDFHGVRDLNPGESQAASNEQSVDVAIAKLVDSLRQMQKTASAMGAQGKKLQDALKQLRGRMPKPGPSPGGPGGDSDDDGDGVNGPQPADLAGLKEGDTREGQELQLHISPEEAARILDGLMLDGGRRLSMSDQQGTKPTDRKGRNW